MIGFWGRIALRAIRPAGGPVPQTPWDIFEEKKL